MVGELLHIASQSEATLNVWNILYREDEASVASPRRHRKEVMIDDVIMPSSPRVKGRSEMKKDFLSGSKESADRNGVIVADSKFSEEHAHKHAKKGLKEYFIDTLQSRKSPAGTEGDGSWTMGTLEHKKHAKKGDDELKKHMKLTEKDIEALIKLDSLERKKGGKEMKETKKKEKKSNKGHRRLFADDDSESEPEIVVIRLDPRFEAPWKQKRAKDKVERTPEHVSKKREGIDAAKLDRSFDKNDAGGERKAAAKSNHVAGTEKKEKKEKRTEHKDWPKVSVFAPFGI